jgi:hypothetical protein
VLANLKGHDEPLSTSTIIIILNFLPVLAPVCTISALMVGVSRAHPPPLARHVCLTDTLAGKARWLKAQGGRRLHTVLGGFF